MFVQMLTTVLHYFWCTLFVKRLELELVGVAFANIIAQVTNIILIIVFTFTQRDIREAWFLPNQEALRGLLEYCKLGLPSMLLMSLEQWAFCIQLFITGIASTNMAAAQSIA
jgi:multidrug resistance protein, MATE family